MVVGVTLNLAIWFAIHVLFREVVTVNGFGLSFATPVLVSIDPWALLLAAGVMIAVFRFNIGVLQTLAAYTAAGVLLYLFGA